MTGTGPCPSIGPGSDQIMQVLRPREAFPELGTEANPSVLYDGKHAYVCYEASPQSGNPLFKVNRDPAPLTQGLCWAYARRKFFVLADIATNAKRGKNAAAISPVALEAVKRIDRCSISNGRSMDLPPTNVWSGVAATASRSSPSSKKGRGQSGQSCRAALR